jgi:ABC-2 type transport system ATP-binding protein
MLIVENLRIGYGAKIVVEQINLRLETGQIHGIVGTNGTGKTTLLNTLCGRLPALAGSVSWHHPQLRAVSWAYLEAELFFYQYITGRDYLSLFTYRNPDFDFAQWNELMGLPLDVLVENYSSGMKKKLALIGLMAAEKAVYIFDEPFNHLDIETAQIVQLILQRLREKGKLILLTSHVLETLLTIADHIHHFADGQQQKSYAKADFDQMQATIFAQRNELNKEKINRLL